MPDDWFYKEPERPERPQRPRQPRYDPEAHRQRIESERQQLPPQGYPSQPQYAPQPQAYADARYQPPSAPPRPAAPPARPVAAPKPAVPAKAKAAPKAKGSPAAKIGCSVIAAVIIGGLAWLGFSIYGSSGSFTATVTDTTVLNPASLDVTFKVTNTGSSAQTPTCTVDATDSSGAYSGVNGGTLDEAVQPGQTTTSVIDVTITNQGAQYVTSATVTCTG